MPSYVITGVSRGLGFEFLRQLCQDSGNTVIGLVRDKPSTDKRVADELKAPSNVHVLQADITDYSSLEKAVAAVSEITGGSLDYLVANAGFVSTWDAYDPIGVLGQSPQKLEEDFLRSFRTNVIANIHLINLFMPLILRGRVKKVIHVSTGHADLDPIKDYDADVASGYAMSKAAMNVAVAKFSAQYRKDGVLFISISPGVVDTGHHADATPEQMQSLGIMGQKFMKYAPHFRGPIPADESIRAVVSVWEKASVEKGDGGSYVSHYGNKQWL
ncbi:hypothetical protein CDD83_10353 [Cordyceps sp. RAO-2017]|nr:hypothetical protein CDD83_10353 [Cordyceps sp. RAO-2017]